VEAMVIANDGMWLPPSFVHGAMSWMEHYVGWRICYGSEVLGWHERVRSHILASAARQIQSGDNRGGRIQNVEITVLSNEIIVALYGITLLK
jgi:hypothetical protein